MAQVHYASIAARDLYENAEYIARDRPNAAYDWIDGIEETCELLARHPEIGESRETAAYGRCRSFVRGEYVIFFRGVSDGVEIIRIIHAKRDVDKF